MTRLLAQSRLVAASAACLVGLTVAGCGGGGGGSAPGPVGVWDGTFTEQGTIGSMDAQLVLFPNGVLRTKLNGGLGGLGTWLESGSSLLFQYVYDSNTCSGLVDVSGDALSGTWGYDAETSDGGGFDLTRATLPGEGIWKLTTDSDWLLLVCYPGGSAEIFSLDALHLNSTSGTWSVSGGNVFTADVVAGDEVMFGATLSGDRMSGSASLGGGPISEAFTGVRLR